jgi:hypothetical protein
VSHHWQVRPKNKEKQKHHHVANALGIPIALRLEERTDLAVPASLQEENAQIATALGSVAMRGPFFLQHRPSERQDRSDLISRPRRRPTPNPAVP